MVLDTVRHYGDLLTVILVSVIICSAVVAPPSRGSLIITVFALLLALFLPGYALIAVLFPEGGSGPVTDEVDRFDTSIGFYQDAGIDTFERIIFSFVGSILVTPPIGLFLDTTPYGLHRTSVAISLTVVTVIAGIVAIVHRSMVPLKERFSVWPHLLAIRERVSTASRPAVAVNGLIIVCLLIATSGAIYAAEKADEGETFTELYLLSESDDGDLVNELPKQYVNGTAESVYVGVENQEQTTVTYSVIIRLERVDPDSKEVVETETLNRYEVTLEHGEKSLEERRIRPTMKGENLRLSVFLYRDSPSNEPTVEDAYRHVYVWIDVTERSEGGA